MPTLTERRKDVTEEISVTLVIETEAVSFTQDKIENIRTDIVKLSDSDINSSGEIVREEKAKSSCGEDRLACGPFNVVLA